MMKLCFMPSYFLQDPKPKILKQNVKPKDEEDFETWIARVRKRRYENTV